MTTEAERLADALAGARKALTCLYLEARPGVVDAVADKVEAAIAAQQEVIRTQAAALAERETLVARVAELSTQRDAALGMLAKWCVAVDMNGTGWDDWDYHYKDAMYRPGPLRALLDHEIAVARAQRESWRS